MRYLFVPYVGVMQYYRNILALFYLFLFLRLVVLLKLLYLKYLSKNIVPHDLYFLTVLVPTLYAIFYAFILVYTSFM